MFACGGGDLAAAEHARELLGAGLGSEQDDVAQGLAVLYDLVDVVVRMTLRRDLRQVGDAQHLAARTERAQAAADGLRHRAADTAVHFVEDHRGRAVVPERGDFDRERDA